jgi:RNA polymerase sigma factor (sigma-70 family)
VLNGETDAFRYFVTTYKDTAYSLAVSVVKDEFTAADVVQEAFVKAFENLKTFRGDSKFSTWFFRIVINEAFKILQKKKIRLPGNEFYLPEMANDHLEIADRSFYINEVLKQMPPAESLVLRLFYLNENCIKEICEITGWSEPKIKVTLHRARKTMEEQLVRVLKNEVKSLI